MNDISVKYLSIDMCVCVYIPVDIQLFKDIELYEVKVSRLIATLNIFIAMLSY